MVFLLGLHWAAYAQFMNVRGWSKTERDSLEQGLSFLNEKKISSAFPILEAILNHHPEEEFLKYSYAKCALYSADKQAEAYRLINMVYEKNRKTTDIHYYLALAAYRNYNYDEAILHINTQLNNRRLSPENKLLADNLKKQINVARYYYTHPTKAKISNLGNIVNSGKSETMPVISTDDGQLLYMLENTGQIMMSQKEEGEFKNPVAFDEGKWNGNYKVVGSSHDAFTLFLYRESKQDSGDLYFSRLVGDKYTKPVKLKGDINTPWKETSCSLSPNGQMIYFSSSRPGGRGAKDLYRASLMKDSIWTNIVSLGDTINTAMDEDAPFIHADGKALFFSSNGHSNMSGFDIYKSTLQLKDSAFKKIDNLGYPINSPDDELQFVISANAENAYCSSNRKDGRGLFDIYHIEPNLKGFKPSLCMFKGKVFKNEKPVMAQISIEQNGAAKSYFGTIGSNIKDGSYLVLLPTGGEYLLTFHVKNYKPKTVTIDLSDMVGFVEKIKNVNFDAVLDSIRNTVAVEVIPGASMVIATPTVAQLPANTPTVEITRTVKTETISKVIPSVITETLSVSPTNSTVIPPATTLVTLNNPQKETQVQIKKVEENKPMVDTTLVKRQSPIQITNKKDSIIPKEIKLKKDSIIVQALKTETTSAKKDSVKSVAPMPTKVLVSNAVSASTGTVSRAGNKVLSDNFEPSTATQEKIMMNAYKYGDITYDSLEFRVQVSAFKNNQHYFFPKLEKFGKIEKVELGDGYKRLMLGGSFKTYGRAFAYAKKIIKAGHDDVFIVVVYKGYRYSVEDLEAVGIFK